MKTDIPFGRLLPSFGTACDRQFPEKLKVSFSTSRWDPCGSGECRVWV